jgi:16S rRNA (uracil1498-N3)-methyltransferase
MDYPYFFAEVSELKIDDTFFLLDEEALHCGKTLRMKPGERLFVINGKGLHVLGEILEASQKRCLILVKEVSQQPMPNRLTIAIAPTKNMDRLEWFVEKAVEIGIYQIQLVICQRSERRQIRTDRLQKIALAAAKQSKKAWLPLLGEPMSFNDFLRQQADQKHKLIAHCQEISVKNFIGSFFAQQPESPFVVLIGPEGDFTPEEISSAIGTNFEPCSLGTERLRTETAALYTAAAYSFVVNNT